jgi:DNA-binding NarL/FixJ family response regulator
MNRSKSIRVVTADHNQMACRLLADALAKQPGITVLGSAADYASLIRLVQASKPDLALISAQLPGGPLRDTLDSSHRPASVPECSWVALLDDAGSEAVVTAFRAGASGVFSHSQSDVQLLAKCIRRVTEGQVWVDSQQMHYLLDAFTGKGNGQEGHLGQPPRLTRREESVVRLVVQGLANREIAEHLRLSEHTIKNYLFRIFDKLGVSNRVELALYAVARLNLGEEVAA